MSTAVPQNVCGIHNIVANFTKIYVFHEGVENKGSNEDYSLLHKLIVSVADGLYSD